MSDDKDRREKTKLTALEKRFVKEYAVNPVGSHAYMAASGTKNKQSAATAASKLLKKPLIQQELQIMIEEAGGSYLKRLKENLEFWTRVRDDEDAPVASRIKASENLAKYDQLFVEKREVETTATVQIIDNI